MAPEIHVENVAARPRRPNICRVLRRTGYGKCLMCSWLLVLCGFYATFCHVKHEAYSGNKPLLIYEHGPCAQGYNFCANRLWPNALHRLSNGMLA
ncbi:unnamed protein product [Caenorhabditis angaria]|uniref:Uncharacterized protein n=1 Tax=Caenorhabditis angaria TaxID=860376 RepID=A0A9P1MUH0_9PELO|nr:unnamed protein product [Caenorhabditis angaria]